MRNKRPRFFLFYFTIRNDGQRVTKNVPEFAAPKWAHSSDSVPAVMLYCPQVLVLNYGELQNTSHLVRAAWYTVSSTVYLNPKARIFCKSIPKTAALIILCMPCIALLRVWLQYCGYRLLQSSASSARCRLGYFLG